MHQGVRPVRVKTIIGGLDDMTAKFAEVGAVPSGDGKHTGFNALISEFKQNWPVVKKDLGDLLAIVKNVVAIITGLADRREQQMAVPAGQPVAVPC